MTALTRALEDGGPAFPIITPDMPVQGSPGLSLRDYFAAAALTGICASPTTKIDAKLEDIATASYNIADALLSARKEAKP